MRILLLAHSFNSLTQRLWVELEARGHEISLELDVNDATTAQAVALFKPQLLIAPFLKRAIPESVWRALPCWVVHPGIVGDRGPSALDWAVLEGEARWGVTVLQANDEFDAGDILAAHEFTMRAATKGSLYRLEVAEATVAAVCEALERHAHGVTPTPLADWQPAPRSRARPVCRQSDRAIDWARDTTASVLARIRSADGTPGLLDASGEVPLKLHDAHPEGALRGAPGAWIARRDEALCRATADGAVWIGSLSQANDPDHPFKRPAALVLPELAAHLPEAPLALDAAPGAPTWRELAYAEAEGVGVLHFAFYNGAMSTAQCRRLAAALAWAKARPTQVLVLAGGPDFWSNGLHLNVIEGAADPAAESMANIEAMDDAVLEILTATDQLTLAALQGNAGAGGVFLALAADLVWARSGVVLNPHYKGMGNLYGSEYWTYALPRRVGAEGAARITAQRLPMGTHEARALGLIDDAFGAAPADFLHEALRRARQLATDPALPERLRAKAARRAADEQAKPLAAYRAEELARMSLNFHGFDPSYHVARSHFVRKSGKARTPSWLARHRHPRGV
ncbi:MAG TPA: enoyl-CoA hydratase-related protein [Rubrivivax sp.]|nr:enoyl-CoA hydratase-related protein [Rubrivivax sp.]